MVITVSEAHVREHISTLLNRVQDGAEIIIERDNAPFARLAPEFSSLRAVKPHELTEAQLRDRSRAVEALLQWPKKYVIDPPLTIEEIISARDEGRK